LITQDVNAYRGFIIFIFHRELLLFCLKVIAALEQRTGQDLSSRLIVIKPADPEYAVGINLLESRDPGRRFVQIGELVEILRQHWQLDQLGPRTLELLHSACYTLAANGLTLVEMRPLLANPAFLTACLERVDNPEITDYFRSRYLALSSGMQAVMREPILYRTSSLVADPRFRHIVGQAQSAFSPLEALDSGCWVLLDLDKGDLGEGAATFGAMLLTLLKNSAFARKEGKLVSVYADEFQNLKNSERSAETLFSESRKYSLGLVVAQQFSDQLPFQMRHALEAIGTHVYFQMSDSDSEKAAAALDGGKSLAQLLRNLPQRHFVLKSGSEHWQEGIVPDVVEPTADFTSLYERCRRRWGRFRPEVEAEIRRRQQIFTTPEDSHDTLEGWD
jgi:hypothetical protein